MVKVHRCAGSCNTLNELSNKACVPKPRRFRPKRDQHDYQNRWTETLTKHILCKCKCRFDERKCNSDQWWNNDKCLWEFKKRHVCMNDFTYNCKNWKYLASIMDDSVYMCDETIESFDRKTKILMTKSNM